jgi:hypothetical protein
MAQASNKVDSHDKPERRSGRDRRRVDKAPPGGHERRRSVEPRRPEVEELDISPSEWDRLSGGGLKKGPGAG